MTDLAALPKVVLHDHLDGGLRPQTLLELASAAGYPLPASGAEGLASWIHQGESGSLAGYLEAFRHTVAVMQTPDAIRRVAEEAVIDHAASGVVYAELRFAPLLLTAGGLTGEEVVAAAVEGVRRGMAASGIEVRIIIDALRQFDRSGEVAKLAVASVADLVVGFDIAGPEAGNPIGDHAEACAEAIAGGLHLTLHAGEADGVASISAALDLGAERIGHGVRIIDDAEVARGEIVALGPVAQRVHGEQVPLELSVQSNVDTGACAGPEGHPVGMLHRAGFAVTLNTDNRLMSQTSMTHEFGLAAQHHHFAVSDFATVTEQAMAAAFCDEATRDRLLETRIRPGYAAT